MTGLTGRIRLIYRTRRVLASRASFSRSVCQCHEARRLGYGILALALSLGTAFAGEDAVTASSFGWNPTDATKCLQAAFDSGA